jgi:hypothetical protein
MVDKGSLLSAPAATEGALTATMHVSSNSKVRWKEASVLNISFDIWQLADRIASMKTPESLEFRRALLSNSRCLFKGLLKVFS